MKTKNIEKIKTIALCTFKEIIRSKILLNTVFLGIALLLVTVVAYSFTYGTPSRVAIDFGLGMLSISSVGIAIFIGVGLLSKEIASRTVYMIISRPVPRYAFILGKVLGLILVLILNLLILTMLTLSLYFFIGGEYSSLILWSILFIILESVLVLLLISLLSIVVSQTIAVITTIVLYISGHAVHLAQEALFTKSVPGLSEVLSFYHFILPAFYKLNVKSYIHYDHLLPISYLSSSALYAFMYGGFLITLCVFIFERKNLN